MTSQWEAPAGASLAAAAALWFAPDLDVRAEAARRRRDFTHAFIGEGGHITTQFARVFNYSAKQPLIASPADTLNCEPVTGFPERGKFDRDFGASPGSPYTSSPLRMPSFS